VTCCQAFLLSNAAKLPALNGCETPIFTALKKASLMQSMDKNTIIGFVLLGLLLFGYLYINSKNSLAYEAEKKRQDSLAKIAAQQQQLAPKDSVVKTVVIDTSAAGKILNGEEKLLTVENELFKVVFSNKGAQPKTVFLKQHRSSSDSSLVQMVNGNTDKLSYGINGPANKSAQTSNLYFNEGVLVKNADGSQSVTFSLSLPAGESITHQYTLKPNNYLIDWNVQLNQADKLLTESKFNLQWITQPVQHEKDIDYERQQAQIVYLQDQGYDYNTVGNKTEKKFEESVKWVSVKQQFFNSSLIAKDKFGSGQIQWTQYTKEDTLHANIITQATTNFNTKLPSGPIANIPMQLYYGPNDYNILRSNGVKDMDYIVNLGQGIYAFVRPINQFIVLPLFDMFKRFISSYGIVIALLTIAIRLFTSPLMYPGYLTSAKMKILRPELDELKKKFPDQQQYAMEQMKFMREAGVNTFAGCLPSLLQIPIFFALFSFFNTNVALRGQGFLWSNNLAAYDSIYNLGFSIPFYGNHVSLFTILAVATSFLISIYQMNSTPDTGNPALKYMPYIFPVLMLGFFNNLPSALTWYYTVSNVITLILQWSIKTFIIDHDKILAKIELNRKKPKTKSKWQERLEQIQESQKKMQETRGKATKGR
jgi:YidC/Oxa1 family membrane protein insertase